MRSRRCLFTLAVVLAVGVVAVAVPSPPPPDVAAFDAGAQPAMPAVVDRPRSIDELRARVAEVLAREKVPGVAIALVGRDGPIWIGGVGVADEQTGAPVTA